jgi:hypothetical protein
VGEEVWVLWPLFLGIFLLWCRVIVSGITEDRVVYSWYSKLVSRWCVCRREG